MQDILEKAAKIRLVIFDVDGVLTDGKLFFDEAGNEYKSFHARDGHGIKMLRGSGVEVAVISGRKSSTVGRRLASLGISNVFQGQEDKLPAFSKLCADLDIAPHQVAHVGDDLLDLPLMMRVGLAVAVNDANPGIIPYAHWRTSATGGCGAAREVCELIMKAQDSLKAAIESYL